MARKKWYEKYLDGEASTDTIYEELKIWYLTDHGDTPITSWDWLGISQEQYLHWLTHGELLAEEEIIRRYYDSKTD